MKFTDIFSVAKEIGSEIKKLSASEPEFLNTSENGKVKTSDLPNCFNLSELKWSKEIRAYLLVKGNRIKAEEDAMRLNAYMSQAKKLLRSFPAHLFVPSNFEYAPNTNNMPEVCCRLHIMPYTPTGKLPKYPIMLYVYSTESLFAEIYYGQNGEIGKVHIGSWTDFGLRNGRCYELDLTTIGGDLIINAIYEYNPVTQKKQKMYFIPPSKGEK